MMEFDVKRCTRRCAATDRELRPEEVFYSALIQEGVEVIRRDYAESEWAGPPVKALGCWKSRMPSAHAKRMKLAPNEVMRNLFVELESQVENRSLRYLLTLLLIRRRVLQLQETEADEQGVEWMIVKMGKNDQCKVEVAEPNDAEHADALQDELTQLLYAEEES